MIHIYYGLGKGKTTAAIGLGMRAYGAGNSVLLVQFLKDNKSSELNAVPFDIYNAPDKLSFNPDKSYQPWVDGALDYVSSSNKDVIILDEFLDVIDSFISIDNAVRLLNELKGKEIIITGHKEIGPLFDLADYITLMDKKRHPYDNGIGARRGIEY